MSESSTTAQPSLGEGATRFLKSGPQGLFIGGKFRSSVTEETFETVNPDNEEVITARVPKGGPKDIDAAVSAAREAFDKGPWPRMKPAERVKKMNRLADLLDKHADDLAELDTLDGGLGIATTRAGARGMGDMMRDAAGWANKTEGTTFATGSDNLCFSLREPIGACGIIIPWNGPAALAARKPAIALACGNTVIVKPAEQTPLSALRLAELIAEADFPPGVFNIVTGFGVDAGAALANHPAVDAISFTGSTEVGREIVKASAVNFKKVIAELGGKSPHIIFDDCDMDKAVPNAAMAVFRNQGQMCFAGTRVFVQRSIYEEFAARISKYAESIVVDSPWNPATVVGPLVSAVQYERVTGYIDIGQREGAKRNTGGPREPGRKGYFVKPTVFTNVRNDMRIAKEEIFGPVASLIPFDTEEEAIRLGNETTYGLGSGIWTRDVTRAMRVARQIRAGNMWINGYGVRHEMAPFGGYKHSGVGREGGKYSMDFYTELKSVFIQP